MSCFLSDYDQLIGFKATLLFPSLSLSCELVLRPGVSSSEFLGENEESGRVKHISTDTDTCPMWDHPTHDPPLLPPPQLFSCSKPLSTEWVSLFLPPPLLFTHSLHPLTQTSTFLFPTFSFPVQNDRNCQAIVKMYVCVKGGRIIHVFKGNSVHDVLQSSISPSHLLNSRLHIKWTRVKQGPPQCVLPFFFIFLLLLPFTLLSSFFTSSPQHSRSMGCYINVCNFLLHLPIASEKKLHCKNYFQDYWNEFYKKILFQSV